MRVLLHSCCAPCAVTVVPALAEHEVTAFFYNPNIQPCVEFGRRLAAMDSYAAGAGLEYVRREHYGLEAFLQALAGQWRRPERCRACYRLRLGAAARTAAEMRRDAFTTTLLASPYQDREALGRIGGEEGARHGVEFLFPDLRGRFREGQRQAQEMGLYRQKYCGCIFSEYEAEVARRERQRGE